MPYYSVHVAGGEDGRTVAAELSELFRGKPADYTGHPFFYIKNHRTLSELQKLVKRSGYEVTVGKISKREYEWEKHR